MKRAQLRLGASVIVMMVVCGPGWGSTERTGSTTLTSGTRRSRPGAATSAPTVVKFGMTADVHLLGRKSRRNEGYVRAFVRSMDEWEADFAIDLGDFACQCGQGQTTRRLHDCQLRSLKHHWAQYTRARCPAYIVMGNHDVGWLRGGDETITPDDLYRGAHGGEDITKAEWLAATGMRHRHYSFDVKGYHFIVLDGNHWRGKTAVAPGRDGVAGAYWIDDAQKAWVAKDLAANRDKPKVVFCHQELHHTPVDGSGEGGDVPFPPVGKQASYVDNGWELRKMFAADGKVIACLFGHKHNSRWTVYGGVHYLTLAAMHSGGSYAKVTIGDRLVIEGAGNQRSYSLPIRTRAERRPAIPH